MKEMFFIYCRKSELAEDRSWISKDLEKILNNYFEATSTFKLLSSPEKKGSESS